MKGGQKPIHRQPWYPADFQVDEDVRLLLFEENYSVLAFYRQFIDHSWILGGDLPADPRRLGAILSIPEDVVRKGLKFCLGSLILQEDGRLYQPRVRRDLEKEKEWRKRQSEYGKIGGATAGKGRPKGSVRGTLRGQPNPPPPPPPPPPEEESPSDEGFEQFWAAFPRKVSKADARKAWKQTRKARPPLPEILTSLAAQNRAAGWSENGKSYCPYPATWLRAERWQDDPAELTRDGSSTPRTIRPPVEDEESIERGRRAARAALGGER